jgi:FkbM family methyltransferase
MNISKVQALRRIFLPILRFTATDITIRHPYVRNVRLSLNSFKHKGYWYFRKKREKETMNLFSLLVKPGSHVVEVGGHIGFISIFFMYLVGSRGGRLTVFEPGANNLPYIRRNIEAARALGVKTSLIEKAVGDRIGEVTFFEDSLTGQNNSVVEDFKGFTENSKLAFTAAETVRRTVPITTLDNIFNDSSIDFIKIDVEGFEKSVLFGAQEIIDRYKPILMVEVQADEIDIFGFFCDRDWQMFSDKGVRLESPHELKGNVFVLHGVAHSGIIDAVFKDASQIAGG